MLATHGPRLEYSEQYEQQRLGGWRPIEEFVALEKVRL
jgi:hypothetical protein